MRIRTIDLEFLGAKKSIAAYLVETNAGLALVECGPYSTWKALEAGLATYGYKPSDIQHLFLTHIHFDHAGAAWALAKGGTKVYVHPIGAPHIQSPEKLYNSARMIYGENMDRLWGAMHPIEEERIHVASDFEGISVLGLEWTAHFTPGHASHHIAWAVKKAGGRSKPVVFAGDVAGVRISQGIVVPPCPPPDINVEEWKTSIERIRNLGAKAFYLTHYGKITDIQAHLDKLGARLEAWKMWIKPQFEQQRPIADIVPEFERYVDAELRATGVGVKGLERYNAANPAFMSVSGLMRYWKKHGSV